MLKTVYKRIWVPVFGRLLSKFIPLLEGKPPTQLPTYYVDKEENITKKGN